MDLYATASSVVYDQTDQYNPFSKCYIPFNNVTGLSPVLVIGSTTADLTNPTFVESGFTITPEIATDGTGTYFKVPFKDFSGDNASKVIVGFKYTYDIHLPTIYFSLNEQGTQSDYTSTLTISRIKFSVGLSGIISFKLQRKGSADYDDVIPVINANEYLANDVALAEESVASIPVHQKNTNFTLKAFSDSPYPVSLSSMMWEGYYSPRFYMRA
jgi:hypothetical protein